MPRPKQGPAIGTALALLLLSGCGRSDNAAGSLNEAQNEARKLDRPRPGQYRQTITITKLEIPGAPPEAAGELKEMMSQAQETSFCLTEAMARDGFRDMFDKVAEGGDCKYDRFAVSGGRIDAVLACASPQEGKATVTLDGKVTPEGSDVRMILDQDNPNTAMGKARIGMHLVSQRTGDCAAGS